VQRLNRYICVISLLCIVTANPAYAASLTGVFSGQGRACWGMLTLTGRTIEWTTPYSRCNATAYQVVEEELGSRAPTASFRLEHRNAACAFSYISVRFDPRYPDYWRLTGYASTRAFMQRRQDGPAQQAQRLECTARKLR